MIGLLILLIVAAVIGYVLNLIAAALGAPSPWPTILGLVAFLLIVLSEYQGV